MVTNSTLEPVDHRGVSLIKKINLNDASMKDTFSHETANHDDADDVGRDSDSVSIIHQ